MKRIDAAATMVIALLAFVLSYSKLVGLAERAGYTTGMALLWPLIVDGLAVVATMGVIRLRARRWYAWTLLGSATLVSVVAAVASAMYPTGALPPVAAAMVSVVPPLCLLVAPHLALQLIREGRTTVASDDVAPGQRAAVAAKYVQYFEVEAKKRQEEAAIAGNRNRHEESPVCANLQKLAEPIHSGQKAAIATEIEEWKAVEAKKRMSEGGKGGVKGRENFPHLPESKASDEAGQMLGVSGRSVRDAKYVKQNDPETFEKIKTGEVAPEPVAPQLFAIPDRRTQALRLIAEGMSQRAAAKHVGVSDTTVRRWRKQAS